MIDGGAHILEAHHQLSVDWNGDPGHVITVKPLDWRKRLVSVPSTSR